jgi:endonuclease/exonuclease/phosphatase family metal-dependent hydrolase
MTHGTTRSNAATRIAPDKSVGPRLSTVLNDGMKSVVTGVENAIRGYPWLFVVAGLLLAVAGCATAERAQPSVRVMVFNIHAGRDAAGRPNLEDVAALIRSTNADVALVQEVDRGTKRSGQIDQVQVLGELTKYATAFGRSLDYDGGQYGIAALSRGAIARPATESLPVQPPQARSGRSYEPRVALTLTTATPLGPFQAINTHLDASREEQYRLQESTGILEIVKRLSASSAPLVAGGDFNAEPGSETYRRLMAGGLRDAWLECGAGDGFTYPADKPVKRIDYLFLTAGLLCTHAEVLDTRISDHRPLLVTVTR